MSHELPFLAVTGDCYEDSDFPGLCDGHAVYHLANGNDLDICRGEIRAGPRPPCLRGAEVGGWLVPARSWGQTRLVRCG